MKTATHIAYVCADRGVPIGGRKGASAHVEELTRALVQPGVEVRIIAARTDERLNGGAHAVPIVDASADRATRHMRQLLFYGVRTERERTRAAEMYGLLLNQAVARELERLHKVWRIDAVYERYGLWSYAGAAFARAARVPYLLEVNAPLREEQRRYRDLQNAAAAASLESMVFRAADYVLVPSAALRPYVLAHGARAGGVRVMPNAADPRQFADHPRGSRPNGEFVIGFLGTLKPWHGVEFLVRAFRRLHRRDGSYRLLIAGDGPLRPTLERMVREYRLQRVTQFAGEVDHDAVPALLAQMDVATAPYPRLGGFYFSPLKVFEYLAAGVPVVASDIGQLGEVLVHRDTALLHRPGAVTEMVAHVETLRRQPKLAARMARAGQRLVSRRFTWQRNADRLLRMIARSRKARESTHGPR
jgi:glycosyltransferase involved in cell wall biosynthesis